MQGSFETHAPLAPGAWRDGFFERDTDGASAVISTDDCGTTQSIADYSLVGLTPYLRSRNIEWVSYCFEWPPEMLKEAALTILEACESLIHRGRILTQANPWHVQFDFTKPVLLGHGIYGELDSNCLWRAAPEFDRFFLFPLMLYSAGRGKIVRHLLSDYVKGASVAEIRGLLHPWHKVRIPGYLSRVALFGGSVTAKNQAAAEVAFSLEYRLKVMRRLVGDIERIPLPSLSRAWRAHDEESDREGHKICAAMWGHILSVCKPGTVMDVGTNTGEFAIQAAKSGARVVAVDNDDAKVSRLYEEASAKGAQVLPIVMDFLNPSPPLGLNFRRSSSAQDRFKSDLVCMMSILPGLVLVGRQNFGQILDGLQEYVKRWLVIEFIEEKDPVIRELRVMTRGVLPSWYRLDFFMSNLSQRFKKVEIIGRPSPTRVLILAHL